MKAIVPQRFNDLPIVDQRRVLAAGDVIARFVQQHTAAVLIAPPPGVAGNIDNGSCFILRLQGTPYLGTAWHVLEKWFYRTANGESVVFQVGGACVMPPGRIVLKDEQSDIAFLRLQEREAELVGISAFEPICGWPPPMPSAGEFIHLAGYPAIHREHPSGDALDFRSLGFRLNVKNVSDCHLSCQFEREYWVAASGAVIPPEGIDLGGMSGGPVLLEQALAYPLVGLVSEHTSRFEITRVSTFAHLPTEFGDNENLA